MISLSHKWKQLYGLSTPREGENAKYVESGRGGEGGEGGLEGTERGVWENGHGSKEQVMGRKGTKEETEV
jgi:hypothetical protein